MRLGSTHTGVQHLLLNAGQKSKRTTNVMPVIFDYGNEGMRRYRFGLEVDDQLAAKIAFEVILDNALSKQLRAITRYSYKILAIERLIATQFDFDEIRSVLEAAKDVKSFAALVESRLSDKSMAIPTSEAELDGMLPGIIKRKDTPLPDARRIERMNFYTLSWAVPKIIDKLCGGKIDRGDPPFEIVYDDPVMGTSTRIEIRWSNDTSNIERGRDWFSVKINAGEKTGLWPEYRFELYEGTWRYREPYFVSGYGFKHHAKGLRTLCKILLEAMTHSSGE